MIREPEKRDLDNIGLNFLSGACIFLNYGLVYIIRFLFLRNLSLEKQFYINRTVGFIFLYIELTIGVLLWTHAVITGRTILNAMIYSYLLFLIILYLGRRWIPYWDDKEDTENIQKQQITEDKDIDDNILLMEKSNIQEPIRNYWDLIGINSVAGGIFRLNYYMAQAVRVLLWRISEKKQFYTVLIISFILTYAELVAILFFYKDNYTVRGAFSAVFYAIPIFIVVMYFGRRWIPYWEDNDNSSNQIENKLNY
ncbi:hypothetical protein F9B74_04580 [Pelistega sp. NLN82]|uniref:Uncharacterized protein n=1 Tax=Pelistega ratti TaxID=2652177 RepID=A0A6L9Y715_9BURK|nr:hypothetical protein [Pelistega ratti]NEN75604.1 hypothetical protein [Pelistega ratti]